MCELHRLIRGDTFRIRQVHDSGIHVLTAANKVGPTGVDELNLTTIIYIHDPKYDFVVLQEKLHDPKYEVVVLQENLHDPKYDFVVLQEKLHDPKYDFVVLQEKLHDPKYDFVVLQEKLHDPKYDFVVLQEKLHDPKYDFVVLQEKLHDPKYDFVVLQENLHDPQYDFVLLQENLHDPKYDFVVLQENLHDPMDDFANLQEMPYNTTEGNVLNAKCESGKEHTQDLNQADATHREDSNPNESDARCLIDACSHHDVDNMSCLDKHRHKLQFNAVNVEGPKIGIPIAVNTVNDVNVIPRTVNTEDDVSDNPKSFNMGSDVNGIPKTVKTEDDASGIHRTVNKQSDLRDIAKTFNMDSSDSSGFPTYRTAVQDEGWAWVVCFACFIAHVILDGVYFSVGVVFVEFLDYFGESKRDTAVIVALCFGVGFLLGPLYALLTDRFGCRLVVIAGALISSAAYVLSIFAPNVYLMYLTFGLMAGFGYGCVYLPSILAINYYFNKRRATAFGIATSGSGCGVLVFGPITKQLVNLYSWKGAVLIHAGILLNLVACGLVYLPNDVKTEGDEETNNVAVKKPLQPNQDMINESGFSDEYLSLSTDVNQDVMASCLSEGIDTGDSDTRTLGIGDNDKMTTVNERKRSEYLEYCLGDRQSDGCDQVTRSRTDGFKRAVLSLLKNSHALTLLRNRPYVLFVISSFLTSAVYVSPFVFLPDKAKDDGIDDFKASWLVSTLGMSGLAGRFSSGVISNIRGVNRVFLNIGYIFACGTCIALLPLCATIESLFACCVAVGLLLGSTVTLSSVLVGDLVGKDDTSKAFGIMYFAWGVACLIGPPVIGWLHDISGSYYVSFITAGIVYGSAGLVLGLVPLCRYSYRASNQNVRSADISSSEHLT